MSRGWYEKNREAVLAQKKAQYAADPESKKAATARYRAENQDKVVAFEKRRWSERKNDPEYRAMQAARARAWYANNREHVKRRVRERRLQIEYGLSVEQFESMRVSQGGGCAICGKSTEALVVDHCHRTGLVRGLLCDGCNTGLGRFQDNAAGIRKALDYLVAFESKSEASSA